MAESEIGAIRALLGAKPRPVGWAARRQRIEEVGAHWPVAPDVALQKTACPANGRWRRGATRDGS
jgi:hypothetical protein